MQLEPGARAEHAVARTRRRPARAAAEPRPEMLTARHIPACRGRPRAALPRLDVAPQAPRRGPPAPASNVTSASASSSGAPRRISLSGAVSGRSRRASIRTQCDASLDARDAPFGRPPGCSTVARPPPRCWRPRAGGTSRRGGNVLTGRARPASWLRELRRETRRALAIGECPIGHRRRGDALARAHSGPPAPPGRWSPSRPAGARLQARACARRGMAAAPVEQGRRTRHRVRHPRSAPSRRAASRAPRRARRVGHRRAERRSSARFGTWAIAPGASQAPYRAHSSSRFASCSRAIAASASGSARSIWPPGIDETGRTSSSSSTKRRRRVAARRGASRRRPRAARRRDPAARASGAHRPRSRRPRRRGAAAAAARHVGGLGAARRANRRGRERRRARRPPARPPAARRSCALAARRSERAQLGRRSGPGAPAGCEGSRKMRARDA